MLAGHLLLDLRVRAVLLDQVLFHHQGILVARRASVVDSAVRVQALGELA